MKKQIALLFPVLCLATLSMTAVTAKADTLQLVGVSASSGPDYIYPYEFSINGSSTQTALMCVDFDREVYQNESWTATESTVTAASSTLQKEEAFLFNDAINAPGTYSTSDYQYAVWALEDLAGVQAAGMDSANVQALDALAATSVAHGTGAASYEDGQFTIYTAVPGSQSTGGTPQDFIGKTSAVPEPSSLLLFGSGMMGLAGIVRRKLIN